MYWKLILLLVFINDANSDPIFQNKDQTNQKSSFNFFQKPKKLQEMCLQTTGTRQAYKYLEQANDRVNECLEFFYDEAKNNVIAQMKENTFRYYFYPSTTSDIAVELIVQLCKRRSDLLKCSAKYKRVLEKCVAYENRKKLIRSDRDMKDTFDYICYNNAEKVKSFMNNDGIKCIQSNIEDLSSCGESLSAEITTIFNPFMGSKLEIDGSGRCNNIEDLSSCGDNSYAEDTAIFNPFMKNKLEIDGSGRCKQQMKFYNCIVEKLKICENKTPANILEDILNHETNKCEYYYKYF